MNYALTHFEIESFCKYVLAYLSVYRPYCLHKEKFYLVFVFAPEIFLRKHDTPLLYLPRYGCMRVKVSLFFSYEEIRI